MASRSSSSRTNLLVALRDFLLSDLILREEDLALDAREVSDAPRLVSEEVPDPTDEQRKRPVVIAVHGYGASPHETGPVAEDLRAAGCLVSQVLLAGHSSTVRELAKMSHDEWGAPIAREYERLVARGFAQVTVLAISAGSSLLLDHLSRRRLDPTPSRLIFVSPLVSFVDRRTALLPLFKWLGIKGTRFEPGGSAPGHWYRTRPIETLLELRALVRHCRSELARGLELPPGTRVLIIHSTRDDVVGTAGARLLARGLPGATVELVLVNSTIHVPIKPVGSDREWTGSEVAEHGELLRRIRAFVLAR